MWRFCFLLQDLWKELRTRCYDHWLLGDGNRLVEDALDMPSAQYPANRLMLSERREYNRVNGSWL